MGSTKFIVVQLKELVKTALFVILGILLIGLLVYLFIPKNKETADTAAAYIPGTYASQVMLRDDPVSVEVTVSDSAIEDIRLVNLGETQEVFFPLVKPSMDTLALDIISSQSTDVAISAETPVTSQVLLEAVKSALDQALVD